MKLLTLEVIGLAEPFKRNAKVLKKDNASAIFIKEACIRRAKEEILCSPSLHEQFPLTILTRKSLHFFFLP